MQYLNGALAFAVVMIAFSTAVTGIVELIVRLLRLRQKILRRMIRHFVRDNLKPYITGNLDDIVDRLTRNPLNDPATISSEKGSILSWIATMLGLGSALQSWRNDKASVDSLSAFAMFQRLAKTNIGAILLQEGEERANQLAEDLSRTYERYAAASSEVFRKQTNTIAFFVAIAVAFAANVNAPLIFTFVVQNEEVARSLIPEEPMVSAENQKARERLEALFLQRDISGETNIANIQTLIDALSETRTGIERFGVPIFYGTPGTYTPTLPPTHCLFVASCDFLPWIVQFSCWFFGILIGGILIALGGPFWYKVFGSLSQVAQILGALRGKKSETVIDPEEERAAVEKTIAGEKPAETLRIAQRAEGGHVNPPCG